MLSRGIVATWIAALVAVAATVWLAVYVIDGDALYASAGSAVHAVSFLSFFALIVAVIVLLFLRRFRSARQDLLDRKDTLGHWHVDADDWRQFLAATEPESEADRRSVAITIAVFALLVTGGMALVLRKDFGILAAIALGIIAIAAVGWMLGRRIEDAQHVYRDGDVTVGKDGILVNGVLHVWRVAGSSLSSARLEDGHPARLRIGYRYWTRTGPRFVEVAAPVPEGAVSEARRVCRHLETLLKSGA